DFFFTTSRVANENLKKEGKSDDQIIFVGNTMIDTLLKNKDRFKQPPFWDDFSLQSGEYFVMTLHRPSNVDDKRQLQSIFDVIEAYPDGVPVILPLHPRGRKNMEQFEIRTSRVNFTEPLAYLEFNYLVKHAKGVITDSGGITEETTVMGVPCITLRNST